MKKAIKIEFWDWIKQTHDQEIVEQVEKELKFKKNPSEKELWSALCKARIKYSKKNWGPINCLVDRFNSRVLI